MKLLYFHVPKTAGSSINHFFSKNIHKHHFHIESVEGLSKEFCENYKFVSGHVSFNRMDRMLDLNEWITFATFRDPLSYTISHLKWVRKLADKGEEKRFEQHPEIFQKIALKMKEFDFSQAQEIEAFIDWLESINFYYFHNTQLHYMHQTNNQNNLNDLQIQKAIDHLHKINFVGIQEKLDDFMEMISYEFDWELESKPKVNVNENNYGFDIHNLETQKALLPLYEKDLIIYEEAMRLFEIQKELYSQEANSNILGYIDQINTRNIVGWVKSKDSLQKVDLELFIDDTYVKSVKANLFRPGLKKKGIHPTGRCAFRFELTTPLKSDNCKIHVKNSNIILPLSKKEQKA